MSKSANGNNKDKIRYSQERGWLALGTIVDLLRRKPAGDPCECVIGWSRRMTLLGQNMKPV